MGFRKLFAVFFSLLIAAGVNSCNREKTHSSKEEEIALILEHYSDDLHYNNNVPLSFIPLPVYQELLSAYDGSFEKVLTPEYIRSNIYEIHTAYFSSEKIPLVIQFSNRAVFDGYIAKLEETPMITKDALNELLQFEYSVYIIEEGIGLESENYITTDSYSLFKGEHRYWLSEEEFVYFHSNDFAQDMNDLRARISEK